MNREIAYAIIKAIYLVGGILALIATGAVLAVLSVAGGTFTAMVSGLLLGFALLLGAKAAGNYRRWRSGSVFYVIDQAVRLNLPLPHVIEATARGEGFWLRDRLRSLNDHLVSGAPLSDALRHAVPGLPDSAIQQVAAGEAAGQTPRAVKRVVAQLRTDMRRNPPAELFTWGYPVMIVLVMSMLLGAVQTFIVPKFRRIFEDFEMDLPWMTKVTLAWSDRFGWVIFAAACILAFDVMCWAFWRLCVTPSGRRRWFPGRGLLDALAWRVPLLRGFSAERELGETCQAAADAIDAGVPLDTALHHASVVPGNAALRKAVQRWADLAAQGRTIDEAARRAGMPRLLVGMIATAHSTPVIADALRFVGNYYADRTSRFAELVRSVSAPLVVIAVALMVGWVVVSMFMPLVILIQGTADNVL